VDRGGGILDRLVEIVARLLDAVGLNGKRLLWKWAQRKNALAERKEQAAVLLRSARGPHKMCPSCRALVPRSAGRCSECGASLSRVRAPGFGRLLTQVFPGVTATTSLVLLANGFWFLMMMMAQIKTGEAMSGGLFGGFDDELLVRFGSGQSRFRPDLQTGGEWWRLITPMFLHGGLIHFFFNSYVLLQLGPITEDIYDPKRFWVIYLASGIAGNLLSQLPRPVNTVGASGAVMGLMGLLLVYGFRHGGVLGQSLKSSMIRFGTYMLIFSLLFHSRIDHLSHLGGFLCGCAAGLIVPSGESRHRATAVLWDVAAFGGVLLVLAAFWNVARSLAP
jgi:membrane associated rhomboid family serine protease